MTRGHSTYRGDAPAHGPLPTCPVCHRPAHASDTDDLDRHAECQAVDVETLAGDDSIGDRVRAAREGVDHE